MILFGASKLVPFSVSYPGKTVTFILSLSYTKTSSFLALIALRNLRLERLLLSLFRLVLRQRKSYRAKYTRTIVRILSPVSTVANQIVYYRFLLNMEI